MRERERDTWVWERAESRCNGYRESRITGRGELRSVWPDSAKFRHFVKSLQVFGKFLKVCFLFGKMLSLLWQICDIIEVIFNVANGQILKNNLTIWSHWKAVWPDWAKIRYCGKISTYFFSIRVRRRLVRWRSFLLGLVERSAQNRPQTSRRACRNHHFRKRRLGSVSGQNMGCKTSGKLSFQSKGSNWSQDLISSHSSTSSNWFEATPNWPEHCDKMARLFIQNLAIYVNDNWANGIKN